MQFFRGAGHARSGPVPPDPVSYTHLDVYKRQEEYIALLQQFCRQPSISAQNMGLREMAQLIMQKLQNMHAQTDLVETGGAPIVYAEWAGRCLLYTSRCV